MRIAVRWQAPRVMIWNDERIGCISSILRRSCIDELPRFFSSLRGDMSLIGRRPERPQFVAQYERKIEGYELRDLVKPGVTGVSQIRRGYAEGLERAAVKCIRDLECIMAAFCGWISPFCCVRYPLPLHGGGRGRRKRVYAFVIGKSKGVGDDSPTPSCMQSVRCFFRQAL